MKGLWPLCAAAMLFALVAPVASAAEIQRPEETAYVFVNAPNGWEVVFALYPRQGVAVASAQKGLPEQKRSRWKGVAYAVRPEDGSFAGGVNVTFGKIGGLFGRFLPSEPAVKGHRNQFCKGPRPLSETGHFVGRIVFKGDGGYLRVNVRHARESISRSFRLRCKQGHAQHSHKLAPGLFGYIDPPTRSFSSTDGTMLLSHLNSKHRVREFMALHHLYDHRSSFKAAILEWLPGDVATSRWVEASGVAVDTFTTGESKLHPATAAVDPPFPFSGTATYSRRDHDLRGDLSVVFPGLRLRLAGKQTEAGLCVLTRQMQERVCAGRFS